MSVNWELGDEGLGVGREEREWWCVWVWFSGGLGVGWDYFPKNGKFNLLNLNRIFNSSHVTCTLYIVCNGVYISKIPKQDIKF